MKCRNDPFGIRFRSTPSIGVLHALDQHGRLLALQNRGIGELKVRIAQYDKRRLADTRLGQFQHGAPDASVGRRNQKGNLAVLPKGAFDEIFDEHATPRNRDDETPQAKRCR